MTTASLRLLRFWFTLTHGSLVPDRETRRCVGTFFLSEDILPRQQARRDGGRGHQIPCSWLRAMWAIRYINLSSHSHCRASCLLASCWPWQKDPWFIPSIPRALSSTPHSHSLWARLGCTHQPEETRAANSPGSLWFDSLPVLNSMKCNGSLNLEQPGLESVLSYDLPRTAVGSPPQGRIIPVPSISQLCPISPLIWSIKNIKFTDRLFKVPNSIVLYYDLFSSHGLTPGFTPLRRTCTPLVSPKISLQNEVTFPRCNREAWVWLGLWNALCLDFFSILPDIVSHRNPLSPFSLELTSFPLLRSSGSWPSILETSSRNRHGPVYTLLLKLEWKVNNRDLFKGSRFLARM